MRKIFIVGSLNIDYTFKLNRLPMVGETIICEEFYLTEGGKGNNQATSVAKQGCETYMVGMVGNDQSGKRLVSQQKNNKIFTDYVWFTDLNSTGLASIYLYDQDNQIVVFEGANKFITESQIDDALNIASKGDILISLLGIPAKICHYAFMVAKAKEMITIFNPAPVRKLDPNIFKLVDYIIPNENEAKEITNKTEIKEVFTEFFKLGSKNVIITLGSNGVVFNQKEVIKYIPAHDVKVVDTTAAGDTFIGVFASEIAASKTVEMAVKRANVAAALTIMKQGAQSSIPTREEIDQYMLDHGVVL